ncbi:MAG: phosphoribosylformylglycinamidine synthase subunit PurQ, partial [Chloroflexi bacterium]|nr:phosphoribosylformylglycinamidine synthase subunit PurQ [Chloroflexota bacterium]
MVKPRAIVLTGYGINCDRETQFAFNQAGAIAERVHVNELIGGRVKLSDYQILALPGGFSYGDDLGAGVALANRMRTRLGYDVKRFIDNAKLVIGICNGFQVMANFGLLPALNGGPDSQNVVLTHNDRPRYLDRWVDLQFLGNTPWLKGMQRASFPIAHGEGKFYANPATLR